MLRIGLPYLFFPFFRFAVLLFSRSSVLCPVACFCCEELPHPESSGIPGHAGSGPRGAILILMYNDMI
jgi:hypothetical protein